MHTHKPMWHVAMCIGGSRRACPAHGPLRAQILSFWHTQFSKCNCLGSPCAPTRSTSPYGKSWIRHWCGNMAHAIQKNFECQTIPLKHFINIFLQTIFPFFVVYFNWVFYIWSEIANCESFWFGSIEQLNYCRFIPTWFANVKEFMQLELSIIIKKRNTICSFTSEAFPQGQLESSPLKVEWSQIANHILDSKVMLAHSCIWR